LQRGKFHSSAQNLKVVCLLSFPHILGFFEKKQKNILDFFEKKQKNILRKFFGKFRRCGLKPFLEKENQVNKLF
jgi:hypothetical protein